MKILAFTLIAFVMLCGCTATNYDKPTAATVFTPVSKAGIADEAKPFTVFFSNEYSDAYITKVRWQLVDNGSGNSTYIIEGIENGNKYILKLLNAGSAAQTAEDITVLGRVVRPLSENELREGKPAEQPLDFSKYISVQKIYDIALQEYDSTLQEWKLMWIDSREVIQVILWDKTFIPKSMVIDAVSGEVLSKTP